MENEKRLIDANALVPYLWDLFKFFGSIPCTEADKATQRGIKRCIGEIKKMPTVDAVEVPCRCCDCYYLLNSINSFGVYFFCGHRNGLKNLHNTEKDFCPYGKVRYEDGK